MYRRSLPQPILVCPGGGAITLTKSTAPRLAQIARDHGGAALADAIKDRDGAQIARCWREAKAATALINAAIDATRVEIIDCRAAASVLKSGDLPVAFTPVTAIAAEAFGVVQLIADAHADSALVALRDEAAAALGRAADGLSEAIETTENRMNGLMDHQARAAKNALAYAPDTGALLVEGLASDLPPDWRTMIDAVAAYGRAHHPDQIEKSGSLSDADAMASALRLDAFDRLESERKSADTRRKSARRAAAASDRKHAISEAWA